MRGINNASGDVHLSKKAVVKGKRLTCMDCHSAEGKGMISSVGQDCSKCHGHVVEKDIRQRSAGLGPAEAKSCTSCHAESIPTTRASVPPGRDPFTTMQEVFAGFDGVQHHGTEQACTDCHRSMAPRPGGNRVQATRENWRIGVHASESALARPKNCYACHWRQRGPTWKAWPGVDTTPEEPRVRSKYGNDLDAYPGIKAEGDAR